MDFPPRSLPNLAPAAYSQPGFRRTPDHPFLAQQAYGVYGVDGTSAFTSQAQLYRYTPHQAPHLFNVHPTLPSQGPSDTASVENAQSAFAAPAAPMPPPARPRKRKAPTLRLADWEPHKDRILQLHVEERKSLPEVKEIMKEDGFEAEVRQYRTRISQWKMDKNVKPQEMRAIVRKRQRRNIDEPDKRELVFTVRGMQVPPQKIERWVKRQKAIDSSIDPTSPAASTPSAVGCRTASERGSPALIPMPSPSASIVSPGGVDFFPQSPQMPSPTLSISSIVRPQSSTFVGQSPTLVHRSHGSLNAGPSHRPDIFEIQMDFDARPRYEQHEEENLQNQIHWESSSAAAGVAGNSQTSKSSNPLYKLGVVLINQGRYKAAEDVIRMLAREHQSQSGEDDASVNELDALSLLGHVFSRQGLYTRAERLHRRVLKGREKVLGSEHPDTLISVGNLGLVLEKQGKYEEAEVMQQRALQGSEKVLGPEHPSTLISVNNLGSVLKKQGKYKEAEVMHQRALQGKEKVLGPEHPDTLISIDSLGLVLRKQGKYEEAEAMHRRALQGSEKVLGPEHPSTLTSVGNLAFVLAEQGKYEEAEVMHQRALQGKEKVLGPEHPNTLASVNNLGFVLAEQGKYKEAEVMHQRALQGSEKVLGPEHPSTLISTDNLGLVLQEQGKDEEAEAMHQRALQGQEKVLGPGHPDTLTSVNNLGSVLEEQGKYKEAEAMYQRAFQGRKKVLGLEHPATTNSATFLRSLLEKQGRYEEAEAVGQ